MTIRHAIVPAYLVLALLLGGASAAGFMANLVLQLLALPLIAWAAWRLMAERPNGALRTAIGLLGLLVLIVTVQLIPLPPAIWTFIPGRAAIVQDYRLMQLPLPWLPLSLAPQRSLAGLLWLLPAIATFLGVAAGLFRARLIAWAILVTTAAAVLLGALQVVGGDGGPGYLYAITNYGSAVGFFANSNHQATLLLIAIPFITALQRQLVDGSRSLRSASAIRLVSSAAIVVVIVGLATNLSLAGLGLAPPVALSSYLFIGSRKVTPRRWMAISVVILAVLSLTAVVVGPFGNNLVGKQERNIDQSRQTSFRLTLRAAADYFPIGSGTDSFQQVYHTQEPVRDVDDTFMNHAHSDWIEIALETGVAGLALAAAFLGWWARRAATVFAAEPPDHYARAAIIASAAMLAHSVVDYPLRTAALESVFAACIALIAGARPAIGRRHAHQPSARHLSVVTAGDNGTVRSVEGERR